MENKKSLKQILVIDDEYAIRVLLHNFLENHDYIVKQADSGKAVDKILETFEPEIVITDIMMPQENGLSIVSRIREKSPSIKVIYLSAWIDEAETEKKLNKELANHPNYKLMQKPFDLKELIKTIQELA